MDAQEIKNQVNKSLSEGKSKEEIYQNLLNQKVPINQIQEAFEDSDDKERKEHVQKKAITVLVYIGAVLVGAGMFSFVASNWQQMDKPTKIVLIIFSMVLAYAVGWFVKYNVDLHKTGDAFILLGTIIYGAGIFLIGQMFNIRAVWPDGFILWMFGVIFMAYAMESTVFYFGAVVLGVISICGYPLNILTAFAGYSPFLLTSSLVLVSAAVLTFCAGFLLKNKVSEIEQ